MSGNKGKMSLKDMIKQKRLAAKKEPQNDPVDFLTTEKKPVEIVDRLLLDTKVIKNEELFALYEVRKPLIQDGFCGIPLDIVKLLNAEGLHKKLCLSTPESLSAAHAILMKIHKLMDQHMNLSDISLFKERKYQDQIVELVRSEERGKEIQDEIWQMCMV